MIIRLDAGNDRSGNPRRCFVQLGRCGIKNVWVEHYDEFDAVPKRLRRQAQMSVKFNVTPLEFRAMVSLSRELTHERR